MGAAYQIDRKTVIRGGFGVVYGATSVQTAGGTGNTASASTPAFGQIVGLLQNGIPSNVVSQWPTFNPAAGQPVGAVVAAPPHLDPNAGRPMRLLQWNVTLQREIGRDIAVEAGYVANVGVWEEAGTTLAPQNALSQTTLADYGITSAGFANNALGIAFNTPISALSTTAKQSLTAVGLTQFLPYANFPSSQTVRQALMPFPQYTGLLTPVGAPLGKNWYDALQTKVTKRFSHGLILNANYTYSKTLALISTIDPFNGTWVRTSAPTTFRTSSG